MDDRHSSPGMLPPGSQKAQQPQCAKDGSHILHRLHRRAPNPAQLAGFVSVGMLHLITVVGLVTGLIFFMPVLFILSPILVPIGVVLFIGIAGMLSMCGFGVAALATISWLYRYLKGFNPPGSGQVDYARNRIYDTASQVKDYARVYGGYLQNKVKDAAPSA